VEYPRLLELSQEECRRLARELEGSWASMAENARQLAEATDDQDRQERYGWTLPVYEAEDGS
jgi:hypothetical protein